MPMFLLMARLVLERLTLWEPIIRERRSGGIMSKSDGNYIAQHCPFLFFYLWVPLFSQGMDKLIHDDKGNATISNDGATIMKLLDVIHPAAKILVDIAKPQDSEVGDGTTRVRESF
ncbi:hypothetical protein IFM89_036619 [Coptis chinensis]|uniref:T-complex protein 1 subunit eta n=1 Tax=Coptis chinensis TaxID=261450 RepID=A0A835LTV1_9MAGN|nr:hypothetical protein IFM89_036619 [Coptis chinensis]